MKYKFDQKFSETFWDLHIDIEWIYWDSYGWKTKRKYRTNCCIHFDKIWWPLAYTIPCITIDWHRSASHYQRWNDLTWGSIDRCMHGIGYAKFVQRVTKNHVLLFGFRPVAILNPLDSNVYCLKWKKTIFGSNFWLISFWVEVISWELWSN